MTEDSGGCDSAEWALSGELDDSLDPLLREVVRLQCGRFAAAKLPPAGELVAGKYRLHELIGSGGMGAVFRATHAVSGKDVALKWLLSDSVATAGRFAREAKATGRIDHPNVVDVHDAGEHRGGRYLVMELLRGQSLGDRIRAGRLEPDELVWIMVPTLRGVAAAHARGVIHRDLKPDNVFLCEQPGSHECFPKVLDFGIAKLRTTHGESETLTREGTGLGTPAYMSPEQLEDASNVDERTDIYAAGVMMYEALTGRLPFRGHNHSALVLAIAGQEPVPVRAICPEVPAALERVVLRAMAKRPSDRYPSAEALMLELLACCPEAAPNVAQQSTRTWQAPGWMKPAARVALLLLAASMQDGRPHTPALATASNEQSVMCIEPSWDVDMSSLLDGELGSRRLATANRPSSASRRPSAGFVSGHPHSDGPATLDDLPSLKHPNSDAPHWTGRGKLVRPRAGTIRIADL